MQESETLESQNHDLKNQIQELEIQRRRLVDMLSLHTPTCIKQNINNSDNNYQQFNNNNNNNSNVNNNNNNNDHDPLLLPSYQDNFVQPSLNQPQNCVTDYTVKVENYDTTGQDFYRQESPFVVPTSDAGCTV